MAKGQGRAIVEIWERMARRTIRRAPADKGVEGNEVAGGWAMKAAESTTDAAEQSHPGQPLLPAPLGARRDMSLLMQPDPKNRARQLPVARLGEETDSPRRGPGPQRGESCGQASGKHVGGGILGSPQSERGSIKRKLLQRCLGGTAGHFHGAGGG